MTGQRCATGAPVPPSTGVAHTPQGSISKPKTVPQGQDPSRRTTEAAAGRAAAPIEAADSVAGLPVDSVVTIL